MPETLTLEGKTIELFTTRGSIVGEKKWSTTEVSGGGGSGYIHQGTGSVSTAPITSKTEEHDQFFLKTDDGREISVTLSNVGLALRTGHDVSLFWGIAAGKENGPYLTVHNHSTNDTTEVTDGVQALVGTRRGVFSAIVIAMLLGAFVGLRGFWLFFTVRGGTISLLFFGALGVAVVWFGWRFLATRRRRVAALRTAIGTAIRQAKPVPAIAA